MISNKFDDVNTDFDDSCKISEVIHFKITFVTQIHLSLRQLSSFSIFLLPIYQYLYIFYSYKSINFFGDIKTFQYFYNKLLSLSYIFY